MSSLVAFHVVTGHSNDLSRRLEFRVCGSRCAVPKHFCNLRCSVGKTNEKRTTLFEVIGMSSLFVSFCVFAR